LTLRKGAPIIGASTVVPHGESGFRHEGQLQEKGTAGVARDWDVGRPARTCMATGRDLADDEEHYSALRETGERFVREDYCLEAWPAVDPTGFFSFWRARRPAEDAGGEKRLVVDREAFYSFFTSLEGATERHRVLFRGVAGLVLARKRLLRLDGVIRDSDDRETLRLYDRRVGRVLDVPAPHAAPEEIARIEEELQRLFAGGISAED